MQTIITRRRGLLLASIGLLGIGLGFYWGRVSVQSSATPSVLRHDQNSDGLPDAEFHHEKGVVVHARFDRNCDGQWDYFEWYEGGKVARAEADDNFDGQVDGWLSYHDGNLWQYLHDLDFNGVVDAVSRYRHGVPHALLCRPNGGTNHVRIELYRHGVLEQEYRDTDGDGLLETRLHYDLLGSEMRREELVPAIPPTQLQLE
jgi:hypothetical protein